MAAAAPAAASTSSSGGGGGMRLVATCSDVIRTWELDREPALRPRLEVQATGRAAGQGPWHCVRWNHNNQVLACGGDRGAVALLHESGKVLEVLSEGADGGTGSGSGTGNANERGTPTPVVSLAWGGRSRYLCTSGGSSRRPTLWDLKRKQKLRAYRGHGSSTVTAVAFAPDDSGVASGNNHGEILLHQLQSEEPAIVLPFDPQQQQQQQGQGQGIGSSGSSGPRGLMSPSAISASVRTVEYWAMRPPCLLAGYRNGDARLWDAAAGACVAAFKGQHQAAVTAVMGSPVNNKLLATGGLDRRLLLFDANSRKLLRECRASAPVQALAFGPEGDTLVVGCSSGELAVYDLRKPNIPCVAIEAHPGQAVRALAVQSGASTGGGSGGSGGQGAAATTTITQQQPQQPASSTLLPSPRKPVVGGGGVGAGASAGAAAAAVVAAAPAITTTEPLPGGARPVDGMGVAGGNAATATSSSSFSVGTSTTTGTTTSIGSTATVGTSTASAEAATAGDSVVRGATAPTAVSASSSSAFDSSGSLRRREERPTAATTTADRFVGGGGTTSGIGSSRPGLVVPPALSLTSSSSAFTAAAPVPPAAAGDQPHAPSAGHPPVAAAAGATAGGGGAAMPVPAAAGVGVAASPTEVAVLVEERVREVAEDVKDELGRGLKALHLELLRGQEGMQASVAGLAAAVAALAEENRQLRAELSEMRGLGFYN